RWQEVRRELDPPERAAEAPRDRLREDRLAGARHVLHEQMGATHERHQGEAYLVVLPDDDALDVGEDLVPDLLDVAHRTPVCDRPHGRAPLPGTFDSRPGPPLT